MNWKEWLFKVGAAMGFKAGYQKGFEQSYGQGVLEGQAAGQQFVEWLKQYGSFDMIPTHLLKQLPQGEEWAQRQTLKMAYLVLKQLVQDVGLPEPPQLGNDLADFLEWDPEQHDELIHEIERVMTNPSVLGSLVNYAGSRNELDVEEFLARVHKDPKTLRMYYRLMKNEYFIVQ